jgi:hypothetical protein
MSKLLAFFIIPVKERKDNYEEKNNFMLIGGGNVDRSYGRM